MLGHLKLTHINSLEYVRPLKTINQERWAIILCKNINLQCNMLVADWDSHPKVC